MEKNVMTLLEVQVVVVWQMVHQVNSVKGVQLTYIFGSLSDRPMVFGCEKVTMEY